MKNLETITRRLQAGGLAPTTPVAIVQSATTGEHRQLVSTLDRVALESEHAGFGAPAIVVIGEVAALADKLGWFESRKTEFSPLAEASPANAGGLKPAVLP
jgi:siroheme synthase